MTLSHLPVSLFYQICFNHDKNYWSILQALEKSKYEQSLESVRRFIAIAEKELELYYRHVALYGDPSNRSAYSILDDSRSTRGKRNAEIGEENYSASKSNMLDLELEIDDSCSDDNQSL